MEPDGHLVYTCDLQCDPVNTSCIGVLMHVCLHSKKKSSIWGVFLPRNYNRHPPRLLSLRYHRGPGTSRSRTARALSA